jgi:hypothetical protein
MTGLDETYDFMDAPIQHTIFGQGASAICHINRSDPTPQSVKNEDLTPTVLVNPMHKRPWTRRHT